jgi:hypothetical protein
MAVERAVGRFLHPVFGGWDGRGWPLGGPLLAPEILRVIQATPGVGVVAELELFPVNVRSPQEPTAAQQQLNLPPQGLPIAYPFDVVVEAAQ